ncbi:MAG: helix-turn-helix domain-containing protein [Phycisphaerales bacterium]
MVTDDLEPVWKALANPIRREILDSLREGPQATGELVMLFPKISRFAVMQHLTVLVEANLVIPKKDGRVRMNHLNAVPIRMIYERWVSRYEGEWASALTGLKRAVEGDRGKEAQTGARRGSEVDRARHNRCEVVDDE